MSDPRSQHPEATLGTGGGEEVVVLPWPLLLRHRVRRRAQAGDRYRWWILATVLTGLFSVTVLFTVIAVALPSIAADLDTTTATVTWAITGPMLGFGIAAPILGKTADIYGHRTVYLLGLGGSALAALLSAAAPDAGWLIASRVLGSVLGAGTGAASSGLIFAAFAPEERVKAMGFWSLVGAGAPVLGVVVGAPVVEAVGWRWVFVGQVPLTLVALVAGAVVLPRSERRLRHRLDWLGAGLITLAVVPVLFALNRAPLVGWTAPPVVGGLLVAPLALLAFVRVERRAAEPLLPLAYLRRRNFAAPVLAAGLSWFAYMGGFILAPLLLAGPLFGYGEARIGFLVVPRPLAFSLVAPLAGYVAVRVGERVSATVGCAAVAASMATFALVGEGRLAPVIVGLVLSGIGMGAALPSLAATIANAVDDAHFGVASAAQQLLSQVGTVAGVQVMQTVQAARVDVGLSRSFADAYLVGAAVAALGAVCASFVASTERGETVVTR